MLYIFFLQIYIEETCLFLGVFSDGGREDSNRKWEILLCNICSNIYISLQPPKIIIYFSQTKAYFLAFRLIPTSKGEACSIIISLQKIFPPFPFTAELIFLSSICYSWSWHLPTLSDHEIAASSEKCNVWLLWYAHSYSCLLYTSPSPRD